MEWLLLGSLLLNIWGYGEYRELETKHDFAGEQIKICKRIERTEGEALAHRDDSIRAALESGFSTQTKLNDISDSDLDSGCLNRKIDERYRDNLQEAIKSLNGTVETE